MENSPIYLDFQASTPMDADVADAMCDYIRGHFGNPHSSEHSFGWAARDAIEHARAAVANLIDVDAEDVVFTSGATEANNLAIFGLARCAPEGRDTILVSAIEHSSILEPARALATRGYRVVELPVDSRGQLSLETLDASLSDRVLLVSVGAVNNEIGTLQDVQAIGDRCRATGALFHTDGAQALTARAFRLGSLPVDMASLSSHKSYGPAGVGALYVAPGIANRLRPQLLGGAQQHGLRAGTLPTAQCVGFGRACELLAEVGSAERMRVASLRDKLWGLLKAALPKVALNGPVETSLRHPGNLSVSLGDVDARHVVQRLQPALACSTGSACHSGSEYPSHVLTAIGVNHTHARASLRLSLGRQTTLDEVERAASLVASVVSSS